MSFKPIPCADRWYGLLAILGLVVLDALLLRILITRPVDGLSFLLALIVLGSLLAIFYLSYRSRGAFNLEYWVDRNGITLVWGPTRQIVPMGQIQRVVPSPKVAPLDAASFWHWPCSHRRRMHTEMFGTVNAYGTVPLGEQIILVTSGENYSI